MDLGAPGVDILSTFTTGNLENLREFLPGVELFDAGYAYLSGTSTASPHVAGAATLIPEATRDGATPIGRAGRATRPLG